MNRCEEHYRVLISGLLDGELDAEQQADLDEHLIGCRACQRELDSLRTLFIGTADAFGGAAVPRETWDHFLDDVYNRMERRTGWVLLIVGGVLLTAFGTYTFLMEPWGSALVKTLVATPVIGLLVLFISVLRQRLENIKTDRYTKEVHR
jgi:hypothetical protein